LGAELLLLHAVRGRRCRWAQSVHTAQMLLCRAVFYSIAQHRAALFACHAVQGCSLQRCCERAVASVARAVQTAGRSSGHKCDEEVGDVLVDSTNGGRTCVWDEKRNGLGATCYVPQQTRVWLEWDDTCRGLAA
jgi:hypothetical protein